jgi:hypothetical protein
MAVGQIELLNPVAKVSIKERPMATALDTLTGKMVGIFETNKDWRGFILFIKRVEQLFTERYGVKGFVKFKASSAAAGGYADPNLAQIEQGKICALARTVDFAIVGGGF